MTNLIGTYTIGIGYKLKRSSIMHTQNIKLTGLSCEACTKLARRRIEKIDGIDSVAVELSGDAVLNASREISKEEIKESLAGSDYNVL